MERKRINFIGIPVDAITMEDTVKIVENAIFEKKNIQHVVINAGKVVSMQKDRELFDSVVSCDIINADGKSIIWGSRLLGNYLPCRVTGIDLMQELVKVAAVKNYKCYFLGAKQEVVDKLISIYTNKYGSDLIAGYRNGYISEEEEPEIAQTIAASGAQILFVAITSPKKEKFLHKYREVLSNVNFTMGVGGSFDVIAGYTKRAPIWMQQIGLEWFYRFIQEPRRMWRRYLIGNTKFILLVLKEKMKMYNNI